MGLIKAILLKPLDGRPEGSEVEFEQDDFERLKDMGAVRRAATKAEAPPANKMAKAPANKAA